MPMTASPPARARKRFTDDTERIVLHGVSWETYAALLEEIGESNVRLTFDEGALEISVAGKTHEKVKKLLARMIEMMSFELDIPISSFGSMTMQAQESNQAVEPDECYYVQSAGDLQAGVDPDPAQHPPDLVIEVDISSHSIAKEPIYAKLRVREVWRFDGERVRSLHRDKDGHYKPRENSLAFPFVKMTDVQKFIERLRNTDESTIMRAWNAWLRKRPRRRGG